MPLDTYAVVRPWSRAIRAKVANGEMPPWYADPDRSMAFANDRRLDSDEIDTIVRWVDAGSPRGNDDDLPPPPLFVDTWSHPDGVPPDRVISMPFPFEVPAEGEVPMQDFYAGRPLETDLWAHALELRPGNPAILHHAGVYAVRIREGAQVVHGRLVNPPSVSADGRQAVFSLDRVKLVGQAAGKGFERHPRGTAKRLSADRYVHFNMHYQPTGRPQTDQSAIGVWLETGQVHHEVITNRFRYATMIANHRELRVVGRRPEPIPNIPPFAEEWPITLVHPILEDITLLALSPHMHLRGKAMSVRVVWPDGREAVVLDVPRYDFNWQLHYQLAEPLRIPAGSKIVSTGRYDNSLKNRYNPAPHKEVYWAEQSWDEMFVPHMEYIVDGDRKSLQTAPRNGKSGEASAKAEDR